MGARRGLLAAALVASICLVVSDSSGGGYLVGVGAKAKRQELDRGASLSSSPSHQRLPAAPGCCRQGRHHRTRGRRQPHGAPA